MATEEELRRRRELNAELERTNELLRQEAESLGSVSEAFDSSLSSLEQINSLHNAIKNNVSETEGLSTTEIEKQKQFVQTLRERIDLEVKLGNITAEEGEERKNALSETQKQVDYMKERDDIATNELNTVLKKDQNLISITQKFKNISAIGEKRLSTEELINARMQFGQVVISAILEKVSQLAGKILDIALEVDSASRELMRTATFSYEEARRGLVDITTAAAGSGLTLAESGKAMGLLKEEFSAFTTLTQEGKTSVGAMVGVLDKMGFAGASSAKFLDMTTKSLGMSYQQSLGFLSSLKGFADQAGVSMKRLSADLAANADNIANFGQQGIEVFKEMEIASKQLGMAMSELFAITEKFTTFEGAAGAAAQLNAVLGGDFINSVDLLTASMENPIDVFKQFKQGMDASGKSFDDLDNGMKRVVASSMGVSVQQAGRLLGMDLNTATAAMNEQRQTQETLNEMSNRMLDIMDKLKSAFAALYPAIDPIIDVLATFADYFTTFATGFANFIKENDYLLIVFKMLAGVIGALGLALGVLGTTILPIYAQIKTIQLLFGGIGPAISFVTSKLGGFGAAIVNAISSTLSFAKAIVTNIIGSLFNAISAMLRFAISVTVNIVSSLFRAIGSIISFAGAMISSFVSSLLTAMIHIARFGIAMSVSIINAFASGARAALRFAGTLIASLIPSFSGIISTGFLAGTASTAAGEGAAAGGSAAGIGAIGFLKLAAAFALIGLGIGAAAAGLSLMVGSFKGLGDAAWPAAAAVIGFTVAFGVLMYLLVSLVAGPQAALTAAAIGVLLGVGQAALMIGLGMGLAAAGVALIIASFSLLASSSADLIDKIVSISDTSVSRYMALASVFSELAENINEIDIDILKELNNVKAGNLDAKSSSITGPYAKEGNLDVKTNPITGPYVKEGNLDVKSSPITGPSLSMSPENKTTKEKIDNQNNNNIININIVIDSPIELDKKKIGRFVAQQTSQIIDGKMQEARVATT